MTGDGPDDAVHLAGKQIVDDCLHAIWIEAVEDTQQEGKAQLGSRAFYAGEHPRGAEQLQAITHHA